MRSLQLFEKPKEMEKGTISWHLLSKGRVLQLIPESGGLTQNYSVDVSTKIPNAHISTIEMATGINMFQTNLSSNIISAEPGAEVSKDKNI